MCCLCNYLVLSLRWWMICFQALLVPRWHSFLLLVDWCYSVLHCFHPIFIYTTHDHLEVFVSLQCCRWFWYPWGNSHSVLFRRLFHVILPSIAGWWLDISVDDEDGDIVTWMLWWRKDSVWYWETDWLCFWAFGRLRWWGWCAGGLKAHICWYCPIWPLMIWLFICLIDGLTDRRPRCRLYIPTGPGFWCCDGGYFLSQSLPIVIYLLILHLFLLTTLRTLWHCTTCLHWWEVYTPLYCSYSGGHCYRRWHTESIRWAFSAGAGRCLHSGVCDVMSAILSTMCLCWRLRGALTTTLLSCFLYILLVMVQWRKFTYGGRIALLLSIRVVIHLLWICWLLFDVRFSGVRLVVEFVPFWCILCFYSINLLF
jgi:hypothetical protein